MPVHTIKPPAPGEGGAEQGEADDGCRRLRLEGVLRRLNRRSSGSPGLLIGDLIALARFTVAWRDGIRALHVLSRSLRPARNDTAVCSRALRFCARTAAMAPAGLRSHNSLVTLTAMRLRPERRVR
jgi:hypothetical protein